MPAQITIQDTDSSVCSPKPTLDVEPASGTARSLHEEVTKMPEAVLIGSSQQSDQVVATTTTAQSTDHVDTSSINAKYRIQSNPAIPEKTSVYTVKELSANQYAHTDPLTTPIEDCFHWEQEFQDLVDNHGNEFYLVVFRSVRRPSVDSEKLFFADAAAQEEARLSGGLLKVWKKYCHFPFILSWVHLSSCSCITCGTAIEFQPEKNKLVGKSPTLMCVCLKMPPWIGQSPLR